MLRRQTDSNQAGPFINLRAARTHISIAAIKLTLGVIMASKTEAPLKRSMILRICDRSANQSAWA